MKKLDFINCFKFYDFIVTNLSLRHGLYFLPGWRRSSLSQSNPNLKNLVIQL